MLNHLTDNNLRHMRGVAEWMYNHADLVSNQVCIGEPSDEMKRQLYLLGYLHDVGKAFFSQENHAVGGGVFLMGKLKFKDSLGESTDLSAKAIMCHGSGELCEEDNPILDLLNAADMSVDSEGNDVGWPRRLADIAQRYGLESKAYLDCKEIVKHLIEVGFLQMPDTKESIL